MHVPINIRFLFDVLENHEKCSACMISGFRRSAGEICAVLGYYEA